MMNSRALLVVVLLGLVLVLLAAQKGLPFALFLPLVIPFFWAGRKE